MGGRNFGEASKCYFIFTRDLGMVLVSARGVRKISSKLRFLLQDFAYLKIDLVRTKDFWRLTSVLRINRLEKLPRPETFGVLVNISKLLRRLLAGEDKNEILFSDLLAGLSILEKSETKDELLDTEILIVLRILNDLGYIGSREVPESFVRSPLEGSLILEISKNRAKVLRQINRALRETHL